MPRAKPAERIQQLEERRARISATIQRVRARETQAERRRETRRLILTGEMAVAKVARGDWTEAWFLAAMDQFLTRESDRRLFELPPRQPEAEAARPPSPAPTPPAPRRRAQTRAQKRRKRKRRLRKP